MPVTMISRNRSRILWLYRCDGCTLEREWNEYLHPPAPMAQGPILWCYDPYRGVAYCGQCAPKYGYVLGISEEDDPPPEDQ